MLSTLLAAQSIPNGYRGISLGMSFEEVKQALEKDSLFGYRGERDVSLLPTEQRILIETSGTSFLSRCWFQFYDGKLYTMILNMNTSLVDFYSVFQTLREKYNEPTSLSPEKIVWQNSSVTLSLERPLSLKYVDEVVFQALLEESRVEKSTTEILQKDFLDSL